MNISDLDKVELIKRLYNNARLIDVDPLLTMVGNMVPEITYKDAEVLLENYRVVTGVNGKFLFLDLTSDEVDTKYYNEANGELLFEYIVDEMRNEMSDEHISIVE